MFREMWSDLKKVVPDSYKRREGTLLWWAVFLAGLIVAGIVFTATLAAAFGLFTAAMIFAPGCAGVAGIVNAFLILLVMWMRNCARRGSISRSGH